MKNIKKNSFIIFWLLYSCMNLYAQKTSKVNISGTGKSNNGGVYNYTATVEISFRTEGLLVDVIVSRKIQNFQITSYSYKGMKGSQVGYSFPFTINKNTKKVITDLQFYKGTISYTARNLQPNGSTYLSKSQLAKLFQTFNIDPEKRDCITCNAIEEVKKLNIKAKNVKIEDLGYYDVFSEINSKINKHLREAKANERKKAELKKQTTTQTNTQQQSQPQRNISNNTSTSSYSTESTSSRTQQPQETIYQRNARIANENATRKRLLEQKRRKDAQDFIYKQQREFEQKQRAITELTNNLTTTFTQIRQSWAREAQFQDRISSLTNISSVNGKAIVNEARMKVREINTSYSQKKSEALAAGIEATKRIMSSAQNKDQLLLGGILGAGATALAQASIEKQRKQAQEKLEREKEASLQRLTKKITDKFNPIKKKHLKAAIYSINPNDEEYHLAYYNYSKCMEENAYSMVVKNRSYCDKPNISQPIKDYASPTAKDYYNAYLRKSQSKNTEVSAKSTYFLELAIDKDPTNGEWVYEKSLSMPLNVFEKLVVIQKAYQLSPSSEIVKNAYQKALIDVENTIKAEKTAITNTINDRTDYDWEKHSNLMRIPYRGGQAFVNQKGEILLDFKKQYSFGYRYRSDRNKNNYDDEEFNEGLLKVRNILNQYQFVNTEGKVAFDKEFADATAFSEGLIAVQDLKTKKWGYINNKNETIIPFKYHFAGKFSDSLAFVQKTIQEGKYVLSGSIYKSAKYEAMYINKKDSTVVTGNWDKGEPFKDGFAKVTRYSKNESFMGGGSDKNFYIDITGNKADEQRDNLSRAFNNIDGYATVLNGKHYEIINNGGYVTSKLTFTNKPSFDENGIAIVSNINLLGNTKKYGFINYKGETIADIKYSQVNPFKDGKALVKYKQEDFYIDLNGNKITEYKISKSLTENLKTLRSKSDLKNLLIQNYDEVIESGNGFRIKHDDLYGYINLKGEVIIPISFRKLGLFHNGYATFTKKIKNNAFKCGYVNQNGKITIKEKYSECGVYSEGLAAVGKMSLIGKKVVGYIDENGETIIPFKYYSGSTFNNGKAKVNTGNYISPKYQYIDLSGNTISTK